MSQERSRAFFAVALFGATLLASTIVVYSAMGRGLPGALLASILSGADERLEPQPTPAAPPGAESSAASATDSSSTGQPNIVFILIDDMGFNDIGYQSTDLSAATPVMDGLAARGVKLTNYYAMHMCTPSRAALLTGMYPHRIGMQYDIIHPDSPWGLPRDLKTMADHFRDAGYATHAVGKWHVGHYSEEFLPQNRGFDSYLGFLADEMDYSTHRYLEPYNGTYYNDLYEADADGGGAAMWAHGQYSTDLFTDRAVALIQAHAARTSVVAGSASTATGGSPQRVEIGITRTGSAQGSAAVDGAGASTATVSAGLTQSEPVGRMQRVKGASTTSKQMLNLAAARAAPAAEAMERDAAAETAAETSLTVDAAVGAETAPLFLYLAYQAVHYPINPPGQDELTEDERAVVGTIVNPERRMFAQVLIYLDRAVGRVMAALEESGLADDLVVVVASDNGGCYKYGASNYPLRGFKHFLFEGGLKVPAFVYSPSRLPSGLAGACATGAGGSGVGGSGAGGAGSSSGAPSGVGAEYAQLMHVTDLLPTLAGLAGASLPAGIDGVDHWPAIDATAAAAAADVAAAATMAEAVRVSAVAGPGPVAAAAVVAAGVAAVAAAVAGGVAAAVAAAPPRADVLLYYDPFNSGPGGLFFREEARAAYIWGRHKIIVAEYCNGYHSYSLSDSYPSADDVCSGVSACFSCAGLCGDPEDSLSDRDTYLFDLLADPREENNLYGADPALDAAMLARLDAAVADSIESVWARDETDAATAAWDVNGGYVCPWVASADASSGLPTALATEDDAG
ncbi:unnamed protein product [Phaeothamnion confervicola]